ncbi:MAG: hypothetical protein O3A46_05675, partial [Candidatus Poribacteria bacterium]|nr:hypothetical protein [Candidatus Poribacteria bacterium]
MREAYAEAAVVPANEEGANLPAQQDDQDVGFFAASHGLTGTQKMAVLLVALGPERAKSIIGNFNDDDIEVIVKEIAAMRYINADQREAVLREAYEYIFGEDVAVQGRLFAGRGAAKRILTEAVGGVRARNILDRLDIPQTETFTFVGDNDLENLAYFLENQLPQIAAVTLLHLRPDQAQRVLEMFPEKLKAEVISRMVNIERVDKKMVAMLAETLQTQLEISRDLVNLHGDTGASRLLRAIPGQSQQMVLAAIGETNAALKFRLERSLMTFDDLINIEDRDFALLINRVASTDNNLLPTALKACSEAMKNKIFGAMTSTRREEV